MITALTEVPVGSPALPLSCRMRLESAWDSPPVGVYHHNGPARGSTARRGDTVPGVIETSSPHVVRMAIDVMSGVG